MVGRRERNPAQLPLNRLIVLEAFGSTRDRFGGVVEGFTELDTVWANARSPRTPSEEFVSAAHRELSKQYLTFRIRWRGDVIETGRVVYDGLIWGIKGIGEVGRREYLDIQTASIGATPT